MRPDPKTRKEPSESSDSLWQGPSRERMVVSRYFFDDEQEPPCTRLTFARSRKVDSLLTGWPLLKFGPGLADELYVGAGRERPCRGRAEESSIQAQ
jgi:hypothetical protein